MIKNKLWESMVTVIVSVFILSFLLLAIANIVAQSSNISDEYKIEKNINLLKSNTYNIINKLDISIYSSWEILYLYKDNMNKEYKLFTWTTNQKYQYIDKYWEYISNTWTYEWIFFSRSIKIERKEEIENNINNFILIDIKQTFNN